jgi:hypothetical protein
MKMKNLLTLLAIFQFGAVFVFSQKPLPPPAPLIYKAPLKTDLKDFTAADKSFSITFPGTPKTVTRDMDKAIVTTSSVYRQGSNSVVSVYEFQNNLEEIREKAFELYKSSLRTSPKMTIEAEREIEFDGMPAKEYDILEDFNFHKIRVFISGKRIYELKNDVTNWHILTKYNKDKAADFENETKRFFDSFKLLIKSQKETVPLDLLGITNETSYVNPFFGFSLEFPGGWSLDDPLEIDNRKNDGLAILKTNQEKLDRVLANAVKSEVIIFGVNNKKSGEPNGESFLVGVMKLPAGVSDAATVLKDTRDFFVQNPKIKLHEDVKNVEIKGVRFATMTILTTVADNKIYQKLHVTVSKGYSINFTISYLDEDGRKTLEQIFDSLKFNLK